jgi:hypothetical protein
MSILDNLSDDWYILLNSYIANSLMRILAIRLASDCRPCYFRGKQ